MLSLFVETMGARSHSGMSPVAVNNPIQIYGAVINTLLLVLSTNIPLLHELCIPMRKTKQESPVRNKRKELAFQELSLNPSVGFGKSLGHPLYVSPRKS